MFLAADRREPAVNRCPHGRDTSMYVTVFEDFKLNTWSEGRQTSDLRCVVVSPVSGGMCPLRDDRQLTVCSVIHRTSHRRE